MRPSPYLRRAASKLSALPKSVLVAAALVSVALPAARVAAGGSGPTARVTTAGFVPAVPATFHDRSEFADPPSTTTTSTTSTTAAPPPTTVTVAARSVPAPVFVPPSAPAPVSAGSWCKGSASMTANVERWASAVASTGSWPVGAMLGIMCDESGGDPGIYNSQGSGACGLLQLLPCPPGGTDGYTNLRYGYEKYQSACRRGDCLSPWGR